MRGQLLRRQAPIVPQERTARNFLLISLASLGLAVLLIIVFWQKLSPQVPIFYSRPWGEEQLGPPWTLLIPLGLAAIFQFSNLAVASLLEDQGFTRKVLAVGATIGTVLAAVTVIRIILLLT